MKRKILTLLLVSLSFIFLGCDSSDEAIAIENKTPIKVEQSKKFTLTTTKGENISLEVLRETISSKQLNGKIVLINFWAPWCKPCEKEMPSFVKLQEKYKDDFVILGVLFDKKSTKKEIDDFLKRFKVNFPVTIGEENFRLAKEIDDVKMIPESFLYTKDGIFIKKFIGEISESKLEEHIKANL
jgi:thiol-disulfide isomerase/thioredoxin